MTILDIESASSFWKESFELSKELYYLNFIISARYCCKWYDIESPKQDILGLI